MRGAVGSAILARARTAVRAHLLASVALTVLQACAAEIKPLPGVYVTPGQAASLYIANTNPAVLALDDVRFHPPVVVDCGNGCAYPIPVGPHIIALQESWGDRWKNAAGEPMPSTTISVLKFYAEPDHHYQVIRDASMNVFWQVRAAVSPEIIDLADRRVVSKVVAGGSDKLP
jgi:hypothetical protein